ncbi:MAG: hypothetical protein N2645_16840 [Clostridia bacterium]|nr:hypothetical protein [Clostridia bacterium]
MKKDSIKTKLNILLIVLITFLLSSSSTIVAQVNDLANPYLGDNSTKMNRSHRMLMVDIKRNTAPYKLALPEDAFKGGVLIEYCGFEAFVENADEWKNEFDIFIMSELTSVPYNCKVSPNQIKVAVKKFMEAGVKLLWFPNQAGFKIRKYGPNGYTDSSKDADIQDLFSGLSLENQKVFSGKNGLITYNNPYPLNVDILRNGHIPSGNYICNYKSSDPDTVFPVIAVEGSSVARLTAYKPGKFFIVGDGGAGISNPVDKQPFWKYVYGWEVVNLLLGKQNNIRLAMDSYAGKRIAAVGVDCDVTREIKAIETLVDAFEDKPLELGLVANNVYINTAGFYKGLTDRTRVELVSHTQYLFNSSNRMRNSQEECIIGNNQLVLLRNPFKPTINSVSINGVSLTKAAGDINTASPSITQYAVSEESFGYNYSIDGLLKFNSQNIGKKVVVNYTYDNEYQENVGSLGFLQARGCLTANVLYMDGGHYSIHPSTFKSFDNNKITLAAYSHFPGYDDAYVIVRAREKHPLPLGSIMKPGYNQAVVDTQFFKVSKEKLKNIWFPKAIKRCIDLELPFEFYIHDFPLCEKVSNSIWCDTTGLYNADWKKKTYEDTIEYAKEFYKWMTEQFDKQNAYWMTRSKYVERYYYFNKNLKYDVLNNKKYVKIVAQNSGDEKIKAITFRIPREEKPVALNLSNGDKACFSIENGVLNVWYDIPAGQTLSLTIDYE